MGPGVVSDPAVERTGSPRPVEGAQGSDAAGGLRLIEEVADQSGGGGLAVGAGDPDQREAPARVAVPGGAEDERGAPAVAHHDFGYAGLLRRLDHDGGGSASDRIGRRSGARPPAIPRTAT